MVRAWGVNSQGQCSMPSGLAECLIVAAGGSHTVALTYDATLDRNGNGVPDSVEIAQNPAMDGNGNGIIDFVEVVQKDAQVAALTARLNCGDLNGDGEVNGADLGKLIIGGGQCQ